MSVKPVTYYEVECDEPDCHVKTANLGEYSAWSFAGDAEEQWTDGDGVILSDGRTYCDKHRDGKKCAECDTETPPLTKTDDGWLCESCAKELAS